MNEAYVSLVTNDCYAMGALALGQSLKDTNTTRKLVLLLTNAVTSSMRESLNAIWDELEDIEALDSCDADNLQLLNRPELGVTFTKLHAWRLVRYQKCVFLDADAFVLCNVDELFEREELSAAPDIGWPDCFNSGVFVYKPSLETLAELLELAATQGSFDGGDQGLLNTYWSDWATKDIKYHLPFVYNVTPNMYYQYAPAYKKFGKNACIIHFIGEIKPWHHTYLPESDTVIPIPQSMYQHSPDHLLRWWRLYQSTQPQTQPSSSSSSDAVVHQDHDSSHSHHPDTQDHDSSHSHHPDTQDHDSSHTHHPGVQDHDSSHSHHSGMQGHDSSHSPTPPLRPQSAPIGGEEFPPIQYSRVWARSAPVLTSGGDQSTVSPSVQRQYAWQRGDIEYLGADRYDEFIGPNLIPVPVDRRLQWQKGEIDYLGIDNYDALIEQHILDALTIGEHVSEWYK